MEEIGLIVGAVLSASHRNSNFQPFKVEASRKVPTRSELTFELGYLDDPMHRLALDGDKAFKTLADSLTSDLIMSLHFNADAVRSNNEYLDPRKGSCRPVLKALFETAAIGKNQKISLWMRASEVFRSGTHATIKADLVDALRRLAAQAKFKAGREMEMILVEDESRKTKMHARYLLSIKGGLRFDQGFQNLPDGRHVDVGPIGKSTHNALLDIYFDGKHDMHVTERLILKL